MCIYIYIFDIYMLITLSMKHIFLAYRLVDSNFKTVWWLKNISFVYFFMVLNFSPTIARNLWFPGSHHYMVLLLVPLLQWGEDDLYSYHLQAAIAASSVIAISNHLILWGVFFVFSHTSQTDSPICDYVHQIIVPID